MKKNSGTNLPLYEAVTAYLRRDAARFHMPGHKGSPRGGHPAFRSILPYDITEVKGVDSLFHAEGPILALEERLAELYGAEQTLLSAGGATLCIQTMLMLACGAGGCVVAGRNLHRSAVNTMALLDLRPVWVYPAGNAGEGFLGGYAPSEVEAALSANPEAKAVYLTSPDYYGVMSDLPALAEVCRAHGVPLLVDNAHGAHLKFLSKGWGRLHPMDCGAAMCADSLHKTMPAMTGTALLHLARRTGGAKQAMSMFGSTSPSYPLMLSAEWAAGYAAEDAEPELNHGAQRLREIRERAAEKGFWLPKGPTDPLKLSLGFGAFGLQPIEFEDYLREKCIEPEYTGAAASVLMGSGFNSDSDYDRLLEAVEAFEAPGKKRREADYGGLPRCEQACSLRAAAFAPCETVRVEDSAGRIAARESSPCPPGIPVVMGGERIDCYAADYLKACGLTEISVLTE